MGRTLFPNLRTGTLAPCVRSRGNVLLGRIGLGYNDGSPAAVPTAGFGVTTEALRDAKGAVRLVQWPGDDDEAEEETEVELRWSTTGIQGMVRRFSCGVKPRVLVSESPL